MWEGLIYQKCKLKPIFTQLRPIIESASALWGLPKPSQYLLNPTKISTNIETGMLSWIVTICCYKFAKTNSRTVNFQETTYSIFQQRMQTRSRLGSRRNTSAPRPPSSSSPRSSFGFGTREKFYWWQIIQQVVAVDCSLIVRLFSQTDIKPDNVWYHIDILQMALTTFVFVSF